MQTSLRKQQKRKAGQYPKERRRGANYIISFSISRKLEHSLLYTGKLCRWVQELIGSLTRLHWRKMHRYCIPFSLYCATASFEHAMPACHPLRACEASYGDCRTSVVTGMRSWYTLMTGRRAAAAEKERKHEREGGHGSGTCDAPSPQTALAPLLCARFFSACSLMKRLSMVVIMAKRLLFCLLS